MTDTAEVATEAKPKVAPPSPEAGERREPPRLDLVRIAPIPAVISEAISAITGAILPVSKGEYNAFSDYNYASVDQIYQAVAPIIATHRLNIIPVEMADVLIVSGPDGKNWGKFVIGFVLSVGEVQYFDPHMRETLFIRIEGPQTFSGAKSYAQKSFLRHLFKIATGEPDLDSLPRDDDAPKGNGKVSAKKADKPAATTMTPEESEKFKAQCLAHIKGLKTPLSPEDRTHFAEKFGSEASRMVANDAAIVRKAYAEAARGKPS